MVESVFLSLSASLDKAPHFSRLGDEEVNAGQNASFQCVAAGRASEAEKFLLEVSGLTMGFKAKATCVSALVVWLCCIFYLQNSQRSDRNNKKKGCYSSNLVDWIIQVLFVCGGGGGGTNADA